MSKTYLHNIPRSAHIDFEIMLGVQPSEILLKRLNQTSLTNIKRTLDYAIASFQLDWLMRKVGGSFGFNRILQRQTNLAGRSPSVSACLHSNRFYMLVYFSRQIVILKTPCEDFFKLNLSQRMLHVKSTKNVPNYIYIRARYILLTRMSEYEFPMVACENEIFLT